MKFTLVITILFFTYRTDALKPKFLRGKFSTGATEGFVELPKTPQRAYEMGWARPPEDVYRPFITFCDKRKPLVCIAYNKVGDIIKISAIPTFQNKPHTDFLAKIRRYTKVRHFGQDLYESSVWLLDPYQLKYKNLTVPDSNYVWGPVQSVLTRIEPTAEGMRFVNMLHSQFCLEKMGNHHSVLSIDPVQYISDPYSGELIGWEFIMPGLDGPQRNPLIDDNGSFIIKRSDNLLVNEGLNLLFSKIFSAFHIFLIDDPQATKCPDSLNNIIEAYDKRNRNDDNLFQHTYRKGSVADREPQEEENHKLSLSLKW